MSDLHKKIAQISAKSVIVEGETPQNVKDGEKWIRLISTAPTLDRDDEIIDTNSLRIPLKPKGWKHAGELLPSDIVDLPFLEDHEWNIKDMLGSVRSMFVNADGELETVAGFTSLQRGMDAHTLAKEDHLGNSFSGTFDYSNSYVQDGVIYEAEMIELSMVFKGSNRDARVLAVSKSAKGEKVPMADATKTLTLEEKKAEAERLNQEIAAEEKAAQATDAPEGDQPKPAEGEGDPKPAETAPEGGENTNSKAVKKETQPMSDQDKIAVKTVKDAPEVKPVAKKTAKADKDEIRSLFVEQFVAYKTKAFGRLAELNKKAIELDGGMSKRAEWRAKAISYTDGAALYQSEIVSTDILQEYQNYGRLGKRVNSVDILGGTQWKRIKRTRGQGFRPVGVEETKQEDKPVFAPVTVLPKEHALIVAWYDAIARETPIAVYQQVIQYIAEEFARLEDYIILSFAGVTTEGGDTFAATGLVPILQEVANAAQVVPVAGYDKRLITALGAAYGVIKSAKELTISANRVTWGKMATALDDNGQPIFKMVGEQVQAGALGLFNVDVVDDGILADGLAVIGAYDDYDLVTRGGLETLFSREASVGNLNLFTDDASAVRACVDIAGKPTLVKSFALLEFPDAPAAS